MPLSIRIMKDENESVVIALLKGSLDTDTYLQFKKTALQSIEKSGPSPTLIVDMEHLAYISSMGISSLVEVRRLVEEKGGTMVMAKVPPHITQVFKIVNALPNVKVFEDMAEVDKYLIEVQRRMREA